DVFTDEDVVLHDQAVTRDSRHLADCRKNVGEVVWGDPASDDVEASAGERQVLGRRDDSRPHPRCGVDRDDVAACLLQPARHVAAAGRDVERLNSVAGLAPLDQQVEVRPLLVCRALAERLRTLGPDVGHAANSTARLAASSIVGSTWRFVGEASLRISRPCSAFVPSRRTTMGCSIVIRSSAARMPRATSSQRVIPPKTLKKIDFTCGSRVITSSASTTPSASPPPPRSQKFAGLLPTCATTSTVDIERPAPFPRIPTLPSSFT